tara:strand:+ start:498 stop:1010 length:513 start_codon:yes stop_codon:yes gene_type:complete
MKVAKLVYYSFMTRVIVDEDATESQIVLASKKNMIAKVNTELGENLEEIRSDDECPIGTFPTDNPTIDWVILNPDEKKYLVIGKGIVSQIISFDDYSDWGTIVDVNREPLFDVQIDFDDSVFQKYELDYYQFQYVDLIRDEDGITTQGCSWGNAKITVTKLPLLEVYLIL